MRSPFTTYAHELVHLQLSNSNNSFPPDHSYSLTIQTSVDCVNMKSCLLYSIAFPRHAYNAFSFGSIIYHSLILYLYMYTHVRIINVQFKWFCKIVARALDESPSVRWLPPIVPLLLLQ